MAEAEGVTVDSADRRDAVQYAEYLESLDVRL
jgi:hypothetical protein